MEEIQQLTVLNKKTYHVTSTKIVAYFDNIEKADE
jgi:hypothetical protein